jgi:hypothetical protein
MSTPEAPAGPPTRRTVVVLLWRGPLALQHLAPGEPDPTPEELDAIATEYAAWSQGVRPSVRVLEAVTMRSERTSS